MYMFRHHTHVSNTELAPSVFEHARHAHVYHIIHMYPIPSWLLVVLSMHAMLMFSCEQVSCMGNFYLAFFILISCIHAYTHYTYIHTTYIHTTYIHTHTHIDVSFACRYEGDEYENAVITIQSFWRSVLGWRQVRCHCLECLHSKQLFILKNKWFNGTGHIRSVFVWLWDVVHLCILCLYICAFCVCVLELMKSHRPRKNRICLMKRNTLSFFTAGTKLPGWNYSFISHIHSHIQKHAHT
jgi:hypothetical protein